MGVLIPNKLLFLATPRTGSIATKKALLTISGSRRLFRHHILKKDVKEYNGEHTVSFVRNPFDIIVTWFLLINRKKNPCLSMVDFIDQYSHSDMKKNGTLFYHANDSDSILRYENGPESINNVLGSLNLPKIKIRKDNITAGKKPYWIYYDNKAKRLVEERFRDDLNRFNYSFDDRGL